MVKNSVIVIAALFCIAVLSGYVQAQDTHEVTGKVTDSSDGSSMPGVNILVKGTSQGTSTDGEGRYSISVPSSQDTLIFTFIGYRNLEIPVNGQSVIDVQMTAQAIMGEEMVVVGYGQQRRENLTGAISTVRAEEIGDVNITNFGDAIQGMVPGVQIRSTGAPGAEPSIEIRGLANFSNNDPLYIIDGVPTSIGRDFNVNDIESVEILKDASAAAIYGSRAANGVIIITTKSGREGPMKIEFNSTIGNDWIPRWDLAGRDEWITKVDRAYVEGGFTPMNHLDGNTDWQDVTFKDALRQDQNLTLSGGTESTSFLISLNHQSNDGTTIGSDSERLGVRINTQGQKGIVTVGQNLAISSNNVREFQPWISGGGARSYNEFHAVAWMIPTVPVYDDSNPGGFGYGHGERARTFAMNPVARDALEDGMVVNRRIRGNFFLELDFLENLNYRFNYGLNFNNHNYDYLRREGNYTLNQPYEPSRALFQKGENISHLFENTLDYSHDFDRHKISTLIGQSYQTFNEEGIYGEGRNLARAGEKYYRVLDASTTDARTGGSLAEGAILSYFGRVNYNYDDRYIAEFTIRRDGTSRLSEENRWGNFPSFSGAWRISNESFFNVGWIYDLKLKASHGQLGSSNIGFYDYQGVLNINPQYVFGSGQEVRSGATQVRLVNEDLRWEVLTQTNIGMEAMFLDGRLSTSFNYFVSTTEDVLTQVPILMTTGNDGGNPYVNAASLRNTGVDLDLTWRDAVQEAGLNYSVGLNFGVTRNEILKLGGGVEEILTWQTISEIGRPIGMYYLLKTDGIFRSDQEVLNHTNSEGDVIQPDAQPGDIRYLDANDDGQITGSDRQITGNPWPDFEMGLSFDATWKNFDFQIQGFGAFGFDVFNGPRSILDSFADNYGKRAGYEPWTPQNPDTDNPRAIYGDFRNDRGDTDRWLEDGSFFKIRQLTLGYTVPQSVFGGVFEKLRVSVTGRNLFTFTKYTGLDPEFTGPNIFERTHDVFTHPSTRNISFSLKLSI